MSKRKIKLAVISDIHLGTYGCQAKAVNKYLKSIDPEILVLNGDIIDIWQFSKHYWPQSRWCERPLVQSNKRHGNTN